MTYHLHICCVGEVNEDMEEREDKMMREDKSMRDRRKGEMR